MTAGALSRSLSGSGEPVHVYLSPHLDDAVLSCGGAIHRHVAAGRTVLVITIFAGEADPARLRGGTSDHDPQAAPAAAAGALSPFARQQHGYWGNPPCPMALRRAEDVAALTLLGARARHLDYLDAVYRAAPDARWLYTDVTTLFGAVDPGDPVTPDDLARSFVNLLPPPGEVTLYAPLGAGSHVDHLIVHTAARRLHSLGHTLSYYEDYPYAGVPGAVEAILDRTGAGGYTAEVITLEPADVAAKVAAVAYYRSQLGILFYGAEAMPSRIWSFAAGRGDHCLAERLWWIND